MKYLPTLFYDLSPPVRKETTRAPSNSAGTRNDQGRVYVRAYVEEDGEKREREREEEEEDLFHAFDSRTSGLVSARFDPHKRSTCANPRWKVERDDASSLFIRPM